MLDQVKPDLDKVTEHLKGEFAKLQVGRANPALVEGVMIEAYGSPQPLKNLANVGVMDSQTLSIQPWDKGLIRAIDKGISDAGLGVNPQNNGETIMIKLPLLTQERRLELVKIAKKIAEEAKISARNIRQDYLKKIKAAFSAKEISEDDSHQKEEALQKQIDQCISTIDDLFTKKEQDILKV